jgi:asparagine synthase (glutamine-hydrolysing)
LPEQVPEQRSLESAREELDSLLQQSVREHLISDVPLGVWLSGGIDSSTILHYASRASTSRLKTFSISFRGRSFDESSYIQRMVEEYGTEHEELDLNPELDLQGAIEEFAYYSDEPSADAGALPVWFLSKLCKTRTTVALSGEGADELFGGYLTYRANTLAGYVRKLPPRAIRLALAALRLWPVSNEKISFEYKLKRLLEGSLMSAERAHVYWNGTFSGAEKRSLVAMELPGALDRILGELRAMLSDQKDDLGAYLWFDQKYYLPDDILVKSDRMSMAHAVELRPPFLDDRIVEFAATLPASLKIRGSQQKFLLKELMRDKLPPSILQRKKIGFDIPAHEWVRGPLRSLVVDTLHAGLSDHPEIFHSGAVENYLRDHLEKRINVGYHLWGLMILFLWMKKWRIQAPISSRAAQSLAPAGIGTFI